MVYWEILNSFSLHRPAPQNKCVLKHVPESLQHSEVLQMFNVNDHEFPRRQVNGERPPGRLKSWDTLIKGREKLTVSVTSVSCAIHFAIRKDAQEVTSIAAVKEFGLLIIRHWEIKFFRQGCECCYFPFSHLLPYLGIRASTLEEKFNRAVAIIPTKCSVYLL